MRKRLRKKLHRGEFVEHGFVLKLDHPSFTGADDPMLDEFLDFLESKDLGYGGLCCQRWRGFVEGGTRRSVTEKDRDEVLSWLRDREEIRNVYASCLYDAWSSDWYDKELEGE